MFSEKQGPWNLGDPLGISGMDVMGWVWENNIKNFVPEVKEAATNRPLIVYFNLNPRINRLPQEPFEHCAKAFHFTNLYNA